MHNQLLDNLFVYKKTSALLAAFQLGLFRQIAEHSYISLNKEICSKFGLNERYAELLSLADLTDEAINLGDSHL